MASADLGMLGACVPKECGGRGLTQTQYCRLLEVLGGHCASTALFVNAHHSIGPRAIVLFGTPEQKQQYLPKLASGEWISAFALTEPEAGSDAANVQTTATPTDDGRGYLLNGQKRWITNGGIAQVLTVMARTPVNSLSPGERAGVRGDRQPKTAESKITAFLVTPDMPGFEVVEARMPKCGVRGSATGRLAFHDMFVPKENILGQLGKGLRVALTVLDFGRVTFGATCTGAAKFCLQRAAEHAATANSIRPADRHVRNGQRKAGLHGGRHIRDGSRHVSHRRADRFRPRRLHARNRHAQSVRHRHALANHQRHHPNLRRQSLLHRRAVRTDDARRPH